MVGTRDGNTGADDRNYLYDFVRNNLIHTVAERHKQFAVVLSTAEPHSQTEERGDLTDGPAVMPKPRAWDRGRK